MGCSNNCTNWWVGDPPVYKADPDIAGPGILVVFIASSTIALSLSLIHIILTPTTSPDGNIIDFWAPRLFPLVWDIIRDPGSARLYIDERKAHVSQLPRTVERRKEFFARFFEKIILNLSDQLLLTGTAVLVGGFWTHCSISVYHFALTSDLAWFASNVHLITLDVLLPYLQERPTLRNWRAVLMGCMAIFLTASTIMQGHRDWYISWPYDAQCVFDDLTFANIGGVPALWMYANLVFIVIGYPPSIAGLYKAPGRFVKRRLHDEPAAASDRFIEDCDSRRSAIITQSTRTTQARYFLYSFLMACAKMGLKCYIFLYKLVAALNDSRWFNMIFCLAWFGLGLAGVFGDRKIPRWDMDGSENAMTFGQIVPILLLSSTLLVAREAYDGNVTRRMLANAANARDRCQDRHEKGRSFGGTELQSYLVHSRNKSTQASGPGQSFEMIGVIQSADDQLDRIPPSIWQVGTETGHGSQASGIDDARPISEILKRPTWPQDRVARTETDRTSSLREERSPRRDH